MQINVGKRIMSLETKNAAPMLCSLLRLQPRMCSAKIFCLPAIGACVGLVMGVSLHMYVMSRIKADAVSFDVNIKLLSSFCVSILKGG